MAAENANLQQGWKKRESFSSALVQIAIVAVLLAGAVFFVYQRGVKRKTTVEKLRDARTWVIRDNPEDLAKAQAELEELFAVDGSAKDALALSADIETERWMFHKVPGAEQKAKDLLAKAEGEDSRSEDRYADRALQLIADGKAQEAETYAEELRQKGASSAKLWYALGLAYQKDGALQLSRQAFKQATDKGWKNARYFAAFGEALLDQADYAQAVEQLKKGLEANPDHLQSQLDLALARLYKKDHVKDGADAVKEILDKKDSLTPGLKARALAVQAELSTFSEQYDAAIKAADEALASNAQDHYALLAKARALGLKKDPGALDAFKAAIAAAPAAQNTYFAGATLLQASGNLAGALALLDQYQDTFGKITLETTEGKKVPAIDKDDKYWVVRGDVLRASGKQDDAMAAYDKAIAANSVNLAKAHYAKGALLLEKKDTDKALEELRLVTPDDGSGQIAEAYLAVGEALFTKKDFANGCQSYAFALARLKAQQAPREKLNDVLADVSKKLVANGQKPMAKVWEQEAKPLIQ